MLGCGLRRRELADLEFTDLQQREEHWAIVDLVGKGGHIRTVPVPEWVKATSDAWIYAADLHSGKIFRCVCRAGKCWGDGVTDMFLCKRPSVISAANSAFVELSMIASASSHSVCLKEHNAYKPAECILDCRRSGGYRVNLPSVC